MTEDVVRVLGYATLGSRLKRIGEKLQMQTQELASELAGTSLPTPHNPVLAALDRQGSLSIGELAKALGQSQPGVTRMINKMKADGLVRAVPLKEDRRVSRIALTENGEQLVLHLKATLWPAVSIAVAQACVDLDGPLLQQLDQLEKALDRKPLGADRSDAPLPAWESLSPGREKPE
ncbi:MarR family winged helix-turn-helix transcriptional regulator [Roseibium sp.]|uniref:MarR family winged helix-turn-helix transcriptional regulator n=1 Tax=Roseibium sp. TaxID=1936156 RepID=UPI003BB18CE3